MHIRSRAELISRKATYQFSVNQNRNKTAAATATDGSVDAIPPGSTSHCAGLMRRSRQLTQLVQSSFDNPKQAGTIQLRAVELLSSFPAYGIEDDPFFVVANRIIRGAIHFKVTTKPIVGLAVKQHMSHLYKCDSAIVTNFLSLVPRLEHLSCYQQEEMVAAMVPKLHQIANEMLPSERSVTYEVIAKTMPLMNEVPGRRNNTPNNRGNNGTRVLDEKTIRGIRTLLDKITVGFRPLTESATLLEACRLLCHVSLAHPSSSETVALWVDIAPKLVLALPGATSEELVYLCSGISNFAPSTSTSSPFNFGPSCGSGRRLMNAVARRAMDVIITLPPKGVSAVLRAFYYSSFRHEALVRRCATRIASCDESTGDDCRSSHVLMAVQSLAHLYIKDDALFEALGSRAVACQRREEGLHPRNCIRIMQLFLRTGSHHIELYNATMDSVLTNVANSYITEGVTASAEDSSLEPTAASSSLDQIETTTDGVDSLDPSEDAGRIQFRMVLQTLQVIALNPSSGVIDGARVVMLLHLAESLLSRSTSHGKANAKWVRDVCSRLKYFGGKVSASCETLMRLVG